jgi:hypothetical protein
VSRPRPTTAGRAGPTNLAVALREAFVALNDLVFVRLAERGHGDVRAAHRAGFQYLDETGTTVSVLAERAPDHQAGDGRTGATPRSPRLRVPRAGPARWPGQACPAHRAWLGGGRHRPGSGAAAPGSDHRGSRPRTHVMATVPAHAGLGHAGRGLLPRRLRDHLETDLRLLRPRRRRAVPTHPRGNQPFDRSVDHPSRPATCS